MTDPDSTGGPTSARRAPWQRTLGARYDGLHALLVRIVHPLTFAAFLMTSVVVGGAIIAIAIEFADSDGAGIAFTAIFGLAVAVVGAFTFVLTLPRAIAGLLLTAGWTIGLLVVDDIDRGVYWAIWLLAAASVVLQVALLAWVVPRRWRAGLLHLLGAATLGTAIGAVPVALALSLLLGGNDDQLRLLTIAALAATALVLVVITGAHVLVRRHERELLQAAAKRRRLSQVHVSDKPGTDVPLLALLPGWASHAGPWRGKVGAREAALIGGFTASRSPDVPSIHATLLAVQSGSRGYDFWVRRRDASSDNVLVESRSTQVLEMESIELDERFTIRMEARADSLDAWRLFGPEVLVLLQQLGDAQVCRQGGVMSAWIVGGALDADELDALFDTVLELLDTLERVDSRIGAPRTAATATDA